MCCLLACLIVCLPVCLSACLHAWMYPVCLSEKFNWNACLCDKIMECLFACSRKKTTTMIIFVCMCDCEYKNEVNLSVCECECLWTTIFSMCVCVTHLKLENSSKCFLQFIRLRIMKNQCVYDLTFVWPIEYACMYACNCFGKNQLINQYQVTSKLYCQQQNFTLFYPSIHLLIQVLKKSLPGLL